MGGKRLISELYSLLPKRVTLLYLLALVFVYRNELASSLDSVGNALRWILLPAIAVLGFCAVFAFTLLFGMILRGFRRHSDETEAEKRQRWESYMRSIEDPDLRLRVDRRDSQTRYNPEPPFNFHR